MAVRKGSYSLDERAAEYLDRRAKLTKRSASAVLSDLVAEAARQDARDRALNAHQTTSFARVRATSSARAGVFCVFLVKACTTTRARLQSSACERRPALIPQR
jgi:hypothetical protein